MQADRSASRTAVLVCQGRAAADGMLAIDRYSDPTAWSFLRPNERIAVEQVRAGEAPQGWGARTEFEAVRACAEVMVPRTVAIDDAICAHPTPQTVILGAGLDGRAWRMSGLAGTSVFEVDHPASQSAKIQRVGELPAQASLHFVPVQFGRDDLTAALALAGHKKETATTWIWEGVVPYLSRQDVVTTMRVVQSLSAAGSRIIVAYQTPSFVAGIGRLLMRAFCVVARRPDPLRGEPRRSSWISADMGRLLTDHGFNAIRDDDLLSVAETLAMPIRQRLSLRNGRVVVAGVNVDRQGQPELPG